MILSALQNQKVRGVVYQALMLVGVIFIFSLGGKNLSENLSERNISTGFGFLSKEASFIVSESPIEFHPSDTYAKAFLVGMLNTLRVAFLGIITAVIIGTFIGIFLISKNFLLRNVSYTYVNLLRNTPLILQLFFWYMVMTEFLPNTPDATNIGLDIFLTNRGIYMPAILVHSSYYYMIAGFLVAIVVSIFIHRYANKKQDLTGHRPPAVLLSILAFIILTFLPWALAGFPFRVERAIFKDFDFFGGINISPEFLALFLGLSLYTSTFIAEIIRAGILAIPKGQLEAGLSIGLTQSQLLRLVILPQAMRVIIPPLTNQLLNLTKNSTLAIAIGYPDFVSIANTTLNQTGQAIEAVIMIMAFYLTVSLLISLFMNWFNHYMRIVER